ncbi:MAG: hypothetical protein KatS3mg111_4126 [Pirellulaceae bacterium]|nr:MAG: hypothetical protein KatS3mg111_4126 [Pirellulaceae bacterium]
MKAEEAKRLIELEEENKRLKRLLADAELDKLILKEALEGNFFVWPKFSGTPADNVMSCV